MQIWFLWKKKSVQDRGIYKSSRMLKKKREKITHFRGPDKTAEEEKRKRTASTQSSATMSSRRTERTRYCDWVSAVSLHFQIRYTRRIYAPSLATIPLRKKLRDGFSRRSRQRPPTITNTPHSRDSCSRTSLELLAWGTRNRCTRHTWFRGDPFGWRKGVAIRSI